MSAHKHKLGRRLGHGAGRFWRDEDGQGLIFAAMTLPLLILFVALVYNIGVLIERRTRAQLAADAAVYSGAMIQANTISSIGWINSAMAQLYYAAMRHVVDVNVSAAAARLAIQMKIDAPQDWPGLQAVTTHAEIYQRARDNVPLIKSMMLDLGRMEHAMAILTPRLMEEEMYGVAKRAEIERLSYFPTYRLYPHTSGQDSYLIKQLDDGWVIEHLDGHREKVTVTHTGTQWQVDYSEDGVTTKQLRVDEVSDNHWRITTTVTRNNVTQTVTIELLHDPVLGWTALGGDASGRPTTNAQVTPVDMDGDGTNEGTRVTVNGVSRVYKRDAQGGLDLWNDSSKTYVGLGGSQTTIGGVRLNVNVGTQVNFEGGWVRIGNPSTLHLASGQDTLAHIRLTDPPTITTGFGPAQVSIRGTDADDFDIRVGGFSLRRGEANGSWRKYWNEFEEYWSQQRLTELRPEDAGVLKEWQYDHEDFGALLKQEQTWERFVDGHAIQDSGDSLPIWRDWFDQLAAVPAVKPDNLTFRLTANDYEDVQGNLWLHRLRADVHVPADVYYITLQCERCNGRGWLPVPGRPGERVQCPICGGRDNNGDNVSDVRIFIRDLYADDRDNPPAWAPLICDGHIMDAQDDDAFLYLKIFAPGYVHDGQALPAVSKPLVLSEEFFKNGLNVGVWRPANDAPMLFPQSLEPAWGYVALASARVGLPSAYEGADFDGFRFDDPAYRASWCDQNPQNLYTGQIDAKLTPSIRQISEYDLQHGATVHEAMNTWVETPTSYLWDAVLHGAYQWRNSWDGQADRQVSARLHNMRNRRGDVFNYNLDGIEQVVAH